MHCLISKLQNYYESMSTPVKAVFWFTICSFFQRGISMLTTPIFTRLLSTEEYGQYSTYLSWETVAIMIVTLSLYKSLMNLYIHYENKKLVLSAIYGLEIILGLSWLIIGVVFRNLLSSLMGISPFLIVCLFINCFSKPAFQCWSLYKRYTYSYKTLVVVTLILTVGSSVLGIIAVKYIEKTAISREMANTAVNLLIGLTIYIAIIRDEKVFYNMSIWKFSLGFCIPLIPHYFSEYILQSSDKVMINYMCGKSDVAIYSISYSVGTIITMVTSAIDSSFIPYQYQKIKEGKYDELSKIANGVLIVISALLIGIMLYAREIVLIFGGMRYLESIDTIIPICLGVYFNYLFQIFAHAQEYFEHKIIVVIPSVLSALLNLVLNYVFIRIYGYKAAAYTTFFCYMLFCLLHYIFYKRTVKHDLNGCNIYDTKSILAISICLMLFSVVVNVIKSCILIKIILTSMAVFYVLKNRRNIIKYIKI